MARWSISPRPVARFAVAASTACLVSAGGAPVVEAQALDVTADPYFGTLTLATGFSNDPRTVALTAGGSESAAGLGPDCVGSFSARPDVRLHYTAGQSLPLNIYAVSTEDLTLVINRPDGSWICNDDYSGLNPAVLMSNPTSGQYDIWVGVHGGGFAEGTLYISEFAPNFADGSGSAGSSLDVNGEPHYATLTLSSGFPDDPRTVEVMAGGSESANGLGGGCVGNTVSRPLVRLNYQAGTGLPLNIYAAARSPGADIALVINRPDGSWICNDDYRGLDPAVLMKNPQSGQYDIWVTVLGSETANATLSISELAPRFE